MCVCGWVQGTWSLGVFKVSVVVSRLVWRVGLAWVGVGLTEAAELGVDSIIGGSLSWDGDGSMVVEGSGCVSSSLMSGRSSKMFLRQVLWGS